MDFISLFRVYDKKILKNNKGIFLLCLITMILSMSAVISIQLLNTVYVDSIQDKVRSVNSADINIFSEKSIMSEKQKLFLKNMNQKNKIDIILFSKKSANVFANDEIDTIILNIKTPLDVQDNIKNEQCSISKKVSDRLNVVEGEDISVKSEGALHRYNIGNIKEDIGGISAFDNETELTEDILGELQVTSRDPNLGGKYNGALLNIKNKNKIKTVKENLLREFGSDFTVRTESDLYENIKTRVNLQIQLLNLIGILAYIVCGASIAFTFMVINIKREKEIAIFKVLGMSKKDILFLSIIETIAIGVLTSIISAPLGIITFGYLSRSFLGMDGSISPFLIEEVIRLLIYMLFGMSIIAFIPMDIIRNVPLINIFRARKVGSVDKIIKYKSLLLLYAVVCLVSCLMIKTILGLVIATLSMFLIIFCILGLCLVYWVISKLKLFIKSKYYIIFKELDANKMNTAIVSSCFILGMSIIMIFFNINQNLDVDNINNNNGATNKMVIGASISDENKIDNVLGKEGKKEFYKYYINNISIESINGKNINTIIDEKFHTSKELRVNYQDYIKNRKVLDYDTTYYIPESILKYSKEKTSEDRIIINTNFFNLIHKFNINDKIILRFGDETRKFVVSGISVENITGDAYLLGTIIFNGESKKISNNKESVMYSFRNRNAKIDKVIKQIPSVYFNNLNNMGIYTQRFIDQYRGIFVYSAILVIAAGILFMINGNYFSINKKIKNISIYYASGASISEIYKIYLGEGIVIAIINSLIAILISDGICRFLIEIIAQKAYIFNGLINISCMLIAIFMNMVVYYNSIRKLEIDDIKYILKGAE